MKKSKPPVNTKMSYREFVERSIKALRVSPHKGIHVVYSGFNNAFRQYYNEDPRSVTDKLTEEGFLVSRLARGGAIIALSSESDQKSNDSVSAVLAKILSQS